jgi:hypothetical protein
VAPLLRDVRAVCGFSLKGRASGERYVGGGKEVQSVCHQSPK